MKRGLMLCLFAASSAGALANADGAALFTQHCVVCHAAQGEGTPGFAPRLAGTLKQRAATEAGRAYLAQVLVDGLAGPITVDGELFNNAMPPFAQLTDGEIAALLQHLVGSLNGGSSMVSAAQIEAARTKKLSPGAVRKLRGS